MKNIAFHSNQLGLRGTEVSMYDYAYYNEKILGNKSYIISDANANLDTFKKFQNNFKVFLYNKFEDCFNFIKEKNITHVYYQKAGDYDNKIIPDVKNLIHAVFQVKEIHGEAYAYISSWLANKMQMSDSYVPYIVTMPLANKNFKDKLNIPSNNIVIGRHGGENEFDLPFVYEVIYDILKKRNDITFLFMNTKQFGPYHPNIIYIKGTYDLQNKSNFINTCDYMLHARVRGESFGLAICEFLFHDKPIISWNNGLDKNHIELLNNKGIWYNDYITLYNILKNLKLNNKPIGEYSNIIKEFSPENVMKRFNNIFLNI